MKSRSGLLFLLFLVFLGLKSAATTRYVDVNSANPSPPFTSWATAATSIQDAVDAAANGDLVLVTNGVYQSGGQVVFGGLMNRVAVTKPLTVRSVNGPEVTSIEGAGVRCVYLTNGAFLSGFTLTGGGTLGSGDDAQEQSGGALWGESTSAVASNCIVTASSSARWGGGAAFLTLLNCVVAGNSSGHGGGAFVCALTNCVVTNNTAGLGGGARDSTLDQCVVNSNRAWEVGGGTMGGLLVRCGLTNNACDNGSGGGAYGGTLNYCFLIGNGARSAGGGAMDATLNNCMLAGNTGSSGGGASFASLNNCVLTGNSARSNGGATWYCGLNNCTVTGNSAPVAGGASQSGLNNCILLYNTAASGPNYTASALNYSCTVPLPNGGIGNITADPLLTDAAHLSAGSPCRGAGSGAYVTGVDLDGESWAYPPAIGCDEFYSGIVPGPLSVAVQASYTNFATGFSAGFTGQVSGHATANQWEFGDGTVVSNRLSASYAWATPGDYNVVFRAFNDGFPGGVSATATVHVVTQPVHYVSPGNPTPVPPYTSWGTAATRIQDAVDAASVAGALVLVTNGTYQTGGKVVFGGLTNRVAVTQPLTVRSVNGPATATIQGFQAPGTTNGDDAVRCVYLTNDAVLIGFSLTLGATRSAGEFLAEQTGGGVRCEPSAVVSNCVLAANSANGAGGGASGGTLASCTLAANTSAGAGGGAYDCTLNNCKVSACSASDGGAVNSCGLSSCTVANNSATYGGGASSCTLNNCSLYGNNASADGGGARTCTLNNCTLTGNRAPTGGGANQSSLNNSILFFNAATVGANYLGGTLNFCCTTPLPAGAGNFTNAPLLADFSHVSPVSPCHAAGNSSYAAGFDIDGEAWVNPPSVGCDEYHVGTAIGPLSVAINADHTNVATGFTVNLIGAISGHATSNQWDYGDGAGSGNRPYTAHNWAAPGDYLVVFRALNDSNPGGVSATVVVQVVSQPVHYVAVASTTPAPPYTSWATAATTIQEAVDAASVAGALVLVTNGTYQTGGKPVSGALTNRVAVNKPLFVSSVNGPAQTVIKGNPVVADSAVRCVYLANGAMLSGFTLTNGASRAAGDTTLEQSGGGVWCEPIGVVVSNCVLAGNSAASYGGGAFSGSLYGCLLTGNSAYTGGSVCASLLEDCTLGSSTARIGGAAQGCALNRCTLTNNLASWFGGGASDCTLSQCVLQRNYAGSGGGGVQNSSLFNCLLSANSCSEGGGGAVGSTLNNCTVVTNSSGADHCTVNTSIVYYNTYGDASGSTLNYCCTTAVAGSGPGNFTNEPLFLNLNSADFHLQSGSPCINAGYNAFAPGSEDLDGNLRVVGGTVDVGAYEFQSPASRISYAWLQQYGLPTDGSADYSDPDVDGMNNVQEWIAGTDPTNGQSVLKMLTPGTTNNASGVKVAWESVPGRYYSLERDTNLAARPKFRPLATHISATTNTVIYQDATALGAGPYFYRVGVTR